MLPLARQKIRQTRERKQKWNAVADLRRGPAQGSCNKKFYQTVCELISANCNAEFWVKLVDKWDACGKLAQTSGACWDEVPDYEYMPWQCIPSVEPTKTHEFPKLAKEKQRSKLPQQTGRKST